MGHETASLVTQTTKDPWSGLRVRLACNSGDTLHHPVGNDWDSGMFYPWQLVVGSPDHPWFCGVVFSGQRLTGVYASAWVLEPPMTLGQA